MKNKLYHLICDYGVGDPAFAEVIQRFNVLDPVGQFNVVAVPEFSTIATGFWIAQLGLWNPIDSVVIFSNTAPRHDDHGARKGNEGEKFVYVVLDNGLRMGVVNSGFSLSLPGSPDFRGISLIRSGSITGYLIPIFFPFIGSNQTVKPRRNIFKIFARHDIDLLD